MAGRAHTGAHPGARRHRRHNGRGDAGEGAVALRSPANGETTAYTREQVDGIQRARLLGAACEVIAERGFAGGTVSDIVTRAGVSRRTFYEQFDDREQCALAAFDQAVRLAAARVIPAYSGPGRWRERVRGALVELLAFLEEEPELGSLCVVHVLGAGPCALQRRAEVLRVLATAVEAGGEEARRAREPGALVAEGVVGAVLAVLHARLAGQVAHRDGAAPELWDLIGPLMGMIVLPYLGAAAAEREIARPGVGPRPPVNARLEHEGPVRGLEMRLTYRTVRVLAAIAGDPGASNRRVGEQAGIVDQGQTSKLLQRLELLGLVQRIAGRRKGEPNAWELTSRGRKLVHSVQRR